MMEQKNISAYIAGRLAFCQAVSKVISEDLSYTDCNYADSLSDDCYYERKVLAKLLKKIPAFEPEQIQPYVRELLNEYAELLWADGYLEHYGWNRHSVFIAIAESLEPAELRDHAVQIATEMEAMEVEPTDEASDFEMTM